MSKAFTKETDQDDDDDLGLPSLPSGTRNYMTPAGYARLRAELFELIDVERPKVVELVHWAASHGDRSENGDETSRADRAARPGPACLKAWPS